MLYSRLQEGLDENESILALIQHRVNAEYAYARALTQGPLVSCASEPIFPGAVDKARASYNNGSTLTAQAIRNVSNSVTTSEATRHMQIAKGLEASILEPFGRWAVAHSDRVRNSWSLVDESVAALEHKTQDVKKRQNAYETRCWYADEADDDVRFAPSLQAHATQKEGDAHESPSNMKRFSLRPKSPAVQDANITPNTQNQAQEKADERLGGDSSVEHKKPDEVTHIASTAQNPVTPPKDDVEAQKLKRRETLRQQFGFKERKSSNTHERTQSMDASTKPSEQTYSRLSSYWNLTKERVQDSHALAQVRAVVNGLSDPRHVRLRRDAEAAERAYQDTLREHDKLRCQAEEVLFHEYKLAQKWEMDRVAAIQSVLLAWQKVIGAPMDDSRVSAMSKVDPLKHIQQIVHKYRTGSFRPSALVFRPYYHDDMYMVAGMTNGGFGMDLIAAAKSAVLNAHGTTIPGQGSAAMPTLPPVFHALLTALERSYAEQSRWVPRTGEASDEVINAEKRRIWLYEVPLSRTHDLRRKLCDFYASRRGVQDGYSGAPDQMLDAVDAPVLAATVKLWLLELNSPLIMFPLWDELMTIYEAARVRSVSVSEDVRSEERVRSMEEPLLRDLSAVLCRLPKLHLTCLDSLLAHFYKLVKTTPVANESDDMYFTKLGLAMGGTILRPSSTLPSLVFSELPALLLRDLVKHYEVLIPPLMRQRAKEADDLSPYKQPQLQRRRTTLVDERIKRSSLSGLGTPPNSLQRRATQMETRYVSAPSSRPMSTMTTSRNQQQHGARSVTLSHLQLVKGPIHETASALTNTDEGEEQHEQHDPETPDTSFQSSTNTTMIDGGTPTPVRIETSSVSPPTSSPSSTYPPKDKSQVGLNSSEPLSRNVETTEMTNAQSPNFAPNHRQPQPQHETVSHQHDAPSHADTTASVSPSSQAPRRPRQSVRGPRGPRQVS